MVKFFEDLTTPNANGNWLLPKLCGVHFHEDRACKNIPPSFLATVLKMVRSRLHSNMTNSVCSIRLNCCPEAANSGYVNALQLLVAETNILAYEDDDSEDTGPEGSEVDSMYSYV